MELVEDGDTVAFSVVVAEGRAKIEAFAIGDGDPAAAFRIERFPGLRGIIAVKGGVGDKCGEGVVWEVRY